MNEQQNEWRKMYAEEIARLSAQGCRAEDWDRVMVCTDFEAKNIWNVSFSGDVFLGRFGKKLLLRGGVCVESGLYDVRLHQSRVSDHVYIHRVNRYIANYFIGEGSIIENVDCIYMDGESSFGNGTVVSVLDETGGLPVVLYKGLSAHTAYTMVTNAHRFDLVENVKILAQSYARSLRSETGWIGKGCCIRNAGTLCNVKMEDGCVIDGASILEDGSLCSAASVFPEEHSEPARAYTFAGADVIARHFIMAPGAVVKDGAQIERCFVGEAAELSNGFSAHDSLFFANCQMENGESCASFAGPYTVSMHKSTLMVGGMFSFCNLGSGTNQSNHFYKLGPMHSGMCERGCKTGSDAYVLWPARIGAFSFVKGRHMDNPDTRMFPFSYLLEEGGKSWLSPGATLRSIGTLRDERKWPQRDKRTSCQPIDKICFEALNPQTVQAMGEGLEKLDAYLTDEQTTAFFCNGFVLGKSSVVKGRKLYQKAFHVYLGSALIKKLESLEPGSLRDGDVLGLLLSGSMEYVSDQWTDVSGLLVPDSELAVFQSELEKGGVSTVTALEEQWTQFYLKYDLWSWLSVLQLLAKQRAKAVYELQMADFLFVLDTWEEAMVSFYKQILADGDLDLAMMQRFSPGEKRFSHPFIDALRRTLSEIPEKAAHWRNVLACF